MVHSLVAALAVVAFSASAVFAAHKGPKYEKIPSGCNVDKTSATKDSSDGNKVTWTDRLNQKHEVVLNKGESVTVIFPIPQGGTWTWYDDDKERTGFNRATAWVEATFSHNDGDIEIRSTGWIAGDPAPGQLEEILKSVKDHVDQAGEIIKSGARTVEEVKKIGEAAGLTKK
jgi:hypothetical protein